MSIKYGDNSVNLDELHFPERIDMYYRGVLALGTFVHKLKLCSGKEFDANVMKLSQNVLIEDGGNGDTILRSTRCNQVIHVIGALKSCINRL